MMKTATLPHSISEGGFNALVEQVCHVRRTFSRILESAVYEVDGDLLAISRLNDDFHDMHLALKLSPGHIIRGIEARMERMPYPMCQQAIVQLKALEGLFVFERGILKKIRGLIPRAYGCTHLGELIETSLRALFAAIESETHRSQRAGAGLNVEERRQLNLTEPVLENTCISFNAGTADAVVQQQAREKVEATERRRTGTASPMGR